MSVRKRLELNHDSLLSYLHRKALMDANKQLGKLNEKNQEAYVRQLSELASLQKGKKQYLIPEGIYHMHEEPVFCQKEVPKEHVKAEVVVALCCKEYKTESVTEEFLMHLLQISYMNIVRDYIKEEMIKTVYSVTYKEPALFVSEYYGPGLFDMPVERLEEMCNLLHAEEVGISCKQECLYPSVSFVGVLYITDKKIIQKAACKDCKANIGCEYCMIHNKMER